jgi:hypothetical protein
MSETGSSLTYQERRRFLWILLLAGIAVIGAVLIAVEAEATTLSRLTFGRLVQYSGAIARLRCVSSTVRMENGEIWTDTMFDVVRKDKGFLPSPVVVRMPGGKLQHLISHVDGVPQFQPGEEVYLFLTNQPGKQFHIVGWSQGTFRIHKRARTGVETVTQDSADMLVFDPRTNLFTKEGIRDLSMERFQEKLAREISQPVR